MKCDRCERENCQPALFHICPECEGAGCAICAGSLVPGILPGATGDDSAIIVCSEWRDPEVDAGIDDTRDSLIKRLTAARDTIIRENGI